MSDEKEETYLRITKSDGIFYAVLIIVAIAACGLAWLKIEYMTQKSFNQLNERIEKIEKNIER
ncbi:MAG: hypothetical protein PHE88_12300 [Elusimicrobia bacterium]|nr:hypothetical protein [Elusimicrobiota bacterium]